MNAMSTPPSASRRNGQLLAASVITTAATRFGDREAFFCSATGRRLSFRQVNERSSRLANGLTGLGLKKGSVVALLSSNRVEIVECLFALAKSGLIGMPLNYRLAPAELVALMRSVQAQALVCESQFEQVAALARAQLPGLPHTVVFGAPQGERAAAAQGAHDYEALLAGAPATEPEVDLDEHDPFYFNLTSGTSGMPKCYVLSHYNNTTLWPLFQALDLSVRDTILTVFPLFGRVGYAWVAAGLLTGSRHVLSHFDAALVSPLIESEKVTITNVVPTMAAMLLNHEETARHDLGSLRAFVLAGSLLSPQIRERVKERIGAPLYEYYGLQESGPLVLSTPEDRERRPDSVGRPLAHTEVRIVDDQGRRCRPGEIGEIIGRAPTCTSAYFESPAKSAETFRNGWLHTGDLGSMDEEGYLSIRGRKKDMIITGGQNVFASEVEEAVLTLDEVADCAVIGLPDELWGERVTAVVVLRQGAEVSPEAIVRHCRDRLSGFKTPKQVIVHADPLPKTASGKVQKFMLIERFGAAS